MFLNLFGCAFGNLATEVQGHNPIGYVHHQVHVVFNEQDADAHFIAHLFDQVGQIIYPADVASADEVFEAALEAGAQDVQSSEDGHEIICAVTDFNEVRDGLEAKFGSAESAALSWKPQNTIELDAEGAGTMLKLIDALEDNDDVQNVSSNFEIDDDVLAQLAG